VVSNKNPLVSVIIPNYNHENYLLKRIDTVLAQTYSDFEVILLDDCSTDASKFILQKFKDHERVAQIVFNEKNSGSTFKQWFKGIDLAKGEYIWIAESDDFSSALFLEKAMVCFNNRFAPDVVFVGTTNVDENDKNIGNNTRIERTYRKLLEKDFHKRGNEFLRFFMPDYCIIRNASSVVFKKSILSEASKKVVSYNTIGDFYFWVHLCLKNYKFSYLSEKLNFMRKHSGTVRHNPKKTRYKKEEYRRIHNYVLLSRWYDVDIVKKVLTYKLKQLKKRL